MEHTELGQLLIGLAPQYGFPMAGACGLDAAREAFAAHGRRLDAWLDAGLAGEMSYLTRTRSRRKDPRKIFPEVRGVFCVGLPYGPRASEGVAGSAPALARYAAYLRGRDYHGVIIERLSDLLDDASSRREFPWKCWCDTGPVLERSWAALCGLGWIGKNACLINREFGSMFFIAAAFLGESPGGAPAPMKNYCGTCARCLRACPTGAFAEPGLLDARRCVSYWTLEKRGDLALSRDDLRAMGNRVAGCDECQDVCPYNRKPRPALIPEWSDEESDATQLRDWAALIAESDEAYRRRARRSALSFVKPREFRRNVALAYAASRGLLKE